MHVHIICYNCFNKPETHTIIFRETPTVACGFHQWSNNGEERIVVWREENCFILRVARHALTLKNKFHLYKLLVCFIYILIVKFMAHVLILSILHAGNKVVLLTSN